MAQITPRDRSWTDLCHFMRKVDKVAGSATFSPVWADLGKTAQ